MRKISTALVMLVVVGIAAGCSGGAGGQLFNNNSPAPVAQNPCAPPVCDPTPACAPAAVQGQRPPDARPGEVWCYVRIPAVTRQVEERICVRPASCRQVQVPAVTKQVPRQVCVTPESTRQIPIEAEYKQECYQVCTAPARTEWQRVDCEPTQLAPKEQVGECWTLKEIPPCYSQQTRQICTKPASCRTECIDAVYRTEYDCVTVEPARVDSFPIEAEYETRYHEETVCGPRWEWRRTTECEVPCAVPSYNANAVPGDELPGNQFSGNQLPPAQDAFVAPAGGSEAIGSPDDNVPPTGGLPPLR